MFVTKLNWEGYFNAYNQNALQMQFSQHPGMLQTLWNNLKNLSLLTAWLCNPQINFWETRTHQKFPTSDVIIIKLLL